MSERASNERPGHEDSLAIETLREKIEEYKPQLIGQGYEHFVYALENHPEVVVKVEIDSVRESVKAIWSGEAKEEILEGIKGFIAEREKGTRLLKRYFGTHVLPHAHRMIEIPLPKEAVKILHLDKEKYAHNTLPKRTYAAAMIQKRVDDIDKTISLTGFKKGTDDEFIRHTAQALSATEPSEHNPHVYEASFIREKFYKRLKEDPALQETVKDFLRHAIAYSEETGKILDIGGESNIILVKENNTWNYLLVDALFGALKKDTLAQLRILFEEYIRNPDAFTSDRITREHRTIVNGTNYVKAINNLAGSLGVHERITRVHDGLTHEQIKKIEPLLRAGLGVWRARMAAMQP